MAEAKKAAPAAKAPEFPAFDIAKMTETARNFTETAMKQNTETLEKFKAVSADFTGASEKSLEAARTAGEALSTKIMDNAKANTEAAVAFTQKISGVKTVSEALEAQSEFFRAQFETLSAQAKEVSELAIANTEKTFAPVKAAFEKAGK